MNEFFKVLNYIYYDKKPYSELNDTERKSINAFMMHRFISMVPEYCNIVNDIQSIPNLTDDQVYTIYCNVLPKAKKWSKYIKPSLAKSNNEQSKQLASLFECSQREVFDYMKIISNTQLNDILKSYGQNDPSSTKGNKKTSRKRNQLSV
jgi:hypothetical protein